MTDIDNESAVIAATLRQYRRGHRLLTAYLVAAYAVVVVGVWFYRSVWFVFTGAAFVIGIALLRYVSVRDLRARRALREHRPDLLVWRDDPDATGATKRATPGGGALYVIALILLMLLSLAVRSEAGAARASATTAVTIESCTPATQRGPGECTGQWQADGAIHRAVITWQDVRLTPGSVLTGRYVPGDPGTVYQGGKEYLTEATVASTAAFLLFGLIFFGAYLLLRRKYWLPMMGQLGGGSLRSQRVTVPFRINDGET